MAVPAGPMRLQHWMYGVTPLEGYGVKARSMGLNIALYEAPLAGRYTPIRGDAVQGVGGVNFRMVHPASSGEDVLLSRLGRGPPDELGRPTFQNHIAIAPREVLATARITLQGIDDAIAAFDLQHPNLVGDLPPLEVAAAPAGYRLGAGLRLHLTRAAVETLATRRMKDIEARTLVLARESLPTVRNEILFKLTELLVFQIGIPGFASMSDAPTASALNSFNLVVAPRGVRADESWAIIESSLPAPVLPRVPKADEVYKIIEESYHADTAAMG